MKIIKQTVFSFMLSSAMLITIGFSPALAQSNETEWRFETRQDLATESAIEEAEVATDKSLPIRIQKPHFLGLTFNWPEFFGLNYHYNLDEYWALGATGSLSTLSVSARRYLGTEASAAYLELSPAYHYSNFFYGGGSGPSCGLYGRYGYEMRGDWLTMELSIGPGLVRQSDSSIWFMLTGGLSAGVTF